MFWTEIGNVVKIERAGMDGSERKAVVNSSLGWPGGVAVDSISERVYWTDERLRVIGSATLDGDDIQVKHFRRGMQISAFTFIYNLQMQKLPEKGPEMNAISTHSAADPTDERNQQPLLTGSV